MEPVISSLVSVLLKGCQDSSPEARLLCGECLGELGAVDPGRLDLSHTLTHGDHNTFVVRKNEILGEIIISVLGTKLFILIITLIMINLHIPTFQFFVTNTNYSCNV